MKHFFTILSHEIRMLLVSLSTYIAAIIFLAIMGVIFTSMLDYYSKSAQETTPAVMFFQYFWVPVLIMVPLLTMKSIAEERRLGTLETLLTTPVTTAEVVLGKYFASYFLYMGLWACTGGLFYILHKFALDTRFIEQGPLVGGYIYVAISGLFFISIGIFCSSLARNQAVAGILCCFFLFLLIVGMSFLTNFLAGVNLMQNDVIKPVASVVNQAQVFQHLSDFSHGIVDARQVLFYLSGTVLMLIFSIFTVEVKLLHS